MSGWSRERRARVAAVDDRRLRSFGGRRPPRHGVLLVTLLFGFAGCARHAPDATSTQILRLSQRNEPATLDPALATLPDEWAILRALDEGLLIPGVDGAPPRPGLAERYEVSADGLVYTFHLRADARWSDGAPIVAADLIASWRRALAPATAAMKVNVFFPVKNARAFATGTLTDFSAVGFRAADPRTVVITLERPTPRFPYYVVSGPWLPTPVRTIEQFGRDWMRPENFVGDGPFTLAEWRPGQRVVVKKNPRWRDAASVRLDEIDFIRFDNGDSEERAYRAGQVDATMAVPFSKIDTYARERPAELHRQPMIETRYFSFNTRHRPLDDLRVRRALALALDRRKIVGHVVKSGESAGRFVPPALRADARTGSENQPELAAAHRFDPGAARRLLAEAGLDTGNFPHLELSAWSPSQTPILEAAQHMWRQELGIDIAIAIREARVHWNALAAGDYDIALVSAIPDVADAAQMLGDFVSTAPANYPHWTNPAFDRRLAQAVGTADLAAQNAELEAAEKILLEATPLTPLYFNTKLWLMSPRVHGWQEDGLWTRTYQDIYLDEK